MTAPQQIRGETYHGRRGAVTHGFRYSVDLLRLDPEAGVPGVPLFRRNAPALMSLWDRDHGGPPGQGRGAAWAREVLAEAGLGPETFGAPLRLELIAQPRLLGHVFNPVSFWLGWDAQDALRVVIAEVTNTFGDRHSYLCRAGDLAPITRHMRLQAQKIFHVSPFQPVSGTYHFRFDIRPDRLGIWIDYRDGAEGVFASLTGHQRPLTAWGILGSALRRPFGSRRVLALIHWQALRLWLKGARYRSRPAPPKAEVSG